MAKNLRKPKIGVKNPAAAALLLMRCPVPAVSVTAFIGVAVSLGWAVIRK